MKKHDTSTAAGPTLTPLQIENARLDFLGKAENALRLYATAI